jgi:hypothetical protein
MEEYLHNFKEIEQGRGPSPLNPMECEIADYIDKDNPEAAK